MFRDDPFSMPDPMDRFRNFAEDMVDRCIHRNTCDIGVTEANGLPVSAANPLPVDIQGATITAGSLSVQLTDQGPNADVTRIGNGTNQLFIDASGFIGVNQGTPAALSNAWPIKISDGSTTVGISTVGAVKALKVDVVQTVGGGGGGGTAVSMVDESTFTEGVSSFNPFGGEFQDAGTALTAGQAGIARLTSKRALHINLRDSSGNELATTSFPLPIQIQAVGTHGNAWNNNAVGAGGNSAVVDCQFVANITIFGNTSAATTLSVLGSQDNSHFYVIDTISITSAGDFGSPIVVGARYLQLQSAQPATITATIAGKS